MTTNYKQSKPSSDSANVLVFFRFLVIFTRFSNERSELVLNFAFLSCIMIVEDYYKKKMEDSYEFSFQ